MPGLMKHSHTGLNLNLTSVWPCRMGVLKSLKGEKSLNSIRMQAKSLCHAERQEQCCSTEVFGHRLFTVRDCVWRKKKSQTKINPNISAATMKCMCTVTCTVYVQVNFHMHVHWTFKAQSTGLLESKLPWLKFSTTSTLVQNTSAIVKFC